MPLRTASAPGKIILSGEYAVVFGFPGIAVPSELRVTVTWDPSSEPLTVRFKGVTPTERAEAYLNRVIGLCGKNTGTVTISNQIQLGKGMGSSTALVIALSRALLGDACEAQAREIEDTVNPGHSGLDFTVIWNEKPVLFRKGQTPEAISLSPDLLKNASLIDTGTPNETTAELVAWMKTRESEVRPFLETIGRCTERLAAGEDFATVIREHHRAQVGLGVVTPEAQALIADIEKNGGAAKVLGAGARTGGGGMVLSIKNTR